MGANIRWYIDGHILLIYCWDNFTIDQLHRVSTQGAALVREGERPVHILFDMRQAVQFPHNLPEILRLTPMFTEPGVGWLVVISDSNMVRFLSSAVAQRSNLPFRCVESEAEMVDFFMGIDVRLTDLPAIDNLLVRD